MTKLPIMRNSERGDLKRCPTRWKWAWRDGLKPLKDKDALWFGTGVHIALAEWYAPRGKGKRRGFRRGPHPAETWEAWADEEIRFIRTMTNEADWREDVYVEARELGAIMLDAYVEHYGDDEHMEFIDIEQSGSVLIPSIKHTKSGKTIFDNNHPIVEFAHTFDGVFRDHADNEKIKLLETKTAKQISTRHLSLDDQAGTYWSLATSQLRRDGKIGPKQSLAGITYNFLRKGKPDTRPVNEQGYSLNKDGSISKQQPAPLFKREYVYRSPKERLQQIRRIAAEAEIAAKFRSGELPLIKNPTKDCSWDCDFFEMCELHEQGADWEEYRDAMFKVEDPYKDHR